MFSHSQNEQPECAYSRYNVLGVWEWIIRLMVLSVSKEMQPINMIMIYFYDKCDGGHLQHAQLQKASFELETSIFFLLSFHTLGYAIFFEFLVTVIKHYYINGLHLFWDSFEWFCLETKLPDQGLMHFLSNYYITVWLQGKNKNTVAITKNKKACKNFNNFIGNK